MRRLLLIFLLLMLPLQTVWAATDAYCADCIVATDSDPDTSTAPHGDCTLCHLGHSVVTGAMLCLPLPRASQPALTTPARLKPGGLAARPERPKWLASQAAA